MKWLRLVADNLFRLTKEERKAARNAFGLFFGAALGANLGLLDTMPISDFATVLVFLAAVVWVIHFGSHARSRILAVIISVPYVTLLVWLWHEPQKLFPGTDAEDVHRLIAILAVWFVAVVLIDITPLVDDTENTAN